MTEEETDVKTDGLLDLLLSWLSFEGVSTSLRLVALP